MKTHTKLSLFVFVLITFNLPANGVFAQGNKSLFLHEKLPINSLTPIQEDKLDEIRSKEHVTKADPIKLAMIEQIFQEEYLFLNLDSNRNLKVKHLRTDSYSSGIEVWNGDLVNGNGHVILSVVEGEIYGNINIYNPSEYIAIKPLGDGAYVLTSEKRPQNTVIETEETYQDMINSSNLTNVNTTTIINKDSNVTSDHAQSSTLKIDVLMLATDDAVSSASITSMAGVLGTEFSWAKTALSNVGLDIEFDIVEELEINFNETTNPTTNMNNFKNDLYVKYLRDRYNADIAVLILEDIVGVSAGKTVCGRAAGLGSTYNEAYIALGFNDCIWNPNFNWQTGHEVGHVFGVWHDDESASPSYAKAFRSSTHRTVVAIEAPSYNVVQYYSDKDVTHSTHGSIGSSGVDATRRIEQTDAIVASFENFSTFNMTLSGPSCIVEGNNGYFSSSPVGGYGIPDIEYEFKRDCGGGAAPDPQPFDVQCGVWTFAGNGTDVTGGNYINFGSGRSDNFWFRTIGEDEQSTTHTSSSKYVTVSSSCGSSPFREDEVNKEGQETNLPHIALGNLETQNYPNPFNQMTTIAFQLSERNLVSLKVYNMLGQEISNLVDRNLPVGNHEFIWNAEQEPNGTYYYQLKIGDNTQVRLMTVIK